MKVNIGIFQELKNLSIFNTFKIHFDSDRFITQYFINFVVQT